MLPTVSCASAGAAKTALTASATALFLYIPPAPPSVSLYGTTIFETEQLRRTLQVRPAGCQRCPAASVSRAQHCCAAAVIAPARGTPFRRAFPSAPTGRRRKRDR